MMAKDVDDFYDLCKDTTTRLVSFISENPIGFAGGDRESVAVVGIIGFRGFKEAF